MIVTQQASSSQKALLTLRIPNRSGREQEILCDSVRLSARDGETGRNGGSLGIRPGHMRAIVALSPHTLRAFLNGEIVYEAEISGGIASVCDNVVSVLPE